MAGDERPVGPADPKDVAMAMAFLERMGLRAEDLVGSTARVVPTFEELVPRVLESLPEPSQRIYGTYLARLVREWGPRRLDEPTPAEVSALFTRAQRVAVPRRSRNGGKGAALHTYYAVSAVFRFAVAEGLLSQRENPVARVSKPVKGRSRRHALSPALYGEIWKAATRTGNDPSLDALLLRFHLETAARTGGALALRLGDLDPQQCLIRLREKGSTQRWQPVSPTLMGFLRHHAHDRGARAESSRVLRFADGSPMTKKRYETLWGRVGDHVDSVRTLGVSTHWLRHTTLTWVDRNFGTAVARAYAGHAEPSSNRQGVTHVYVKASVGEVATALQALTREAHPLALEPLSAASLSESHPLHTVDQDLDTSVTDAPRDGGAPRSGGSGRRRSEGDRRPG